MTRRLVALGQEPVGVGFYFSLGHSLYDISMSILNRLKDDSVTIVIIVITVIKGIDVDKAFPKVVLLRNIIGTTLSSTFLITLGIMNAYILYSLIRQMRKILHKSASQDTQVSLDGGGRKLQRFTRVIGKIFDRSWKSLPMGMLFGLKLDTSSELVTLAAASTIEVDTIPNAYLLLFALITVSGMLLVESLNGALMSVLYIKARSGTDPVKILFYSILYSFVTVLSAMFVGIVQCLSIASFSVQPSGGSAVWKNVEKMIDRYEIIGKTPLRASEDLVNT